MIEKWLMTLWYGPKRLVTYALLPLTWLYQLVNIGKQAFGRYILRRPTPCPVIVVGNISVGGVGKTPLVIAMVQFCQQQGLNVGVVSRGYGSRSRIYPRDVLSNDLASEVGDEPLLIVKKTGAPVVIAPNRAAAVMHCYQKYQCDVIISDDGLQHQSMDRAIEIIVIDGERGLGNGFCLPAGPLRDTPNRLKKAHLLVSHNGDWPGAYPMHLKMTGLYHLPSHRPYSWQLLPQPITAVAGIGNPQRFYQQLRGLGLMIHETQFSDHQVYNQQLYRSLAKPVVMTEKDAVKCYPYATGEDYFVVVTAQLSGNFWQSLAQCMHDKGIL
ncbi:tetraacyldisaccharide 4'-kinase [Legionella sp. W05-934-2]|uniref:tetraacyldisaccharide 4'-kinase n=1 Tax=Legionella sp. W05-934-2 TaxID=1198649 RepID=UPI003462729F